MNKDQLVTAALEKSEYAFTKAAAEDLINSVMSAIKEEVAAGGKVTLVGFGTFGSSHRKERAGSNPNTKEPMIIPAYTIPKFTPGQAFKDMLK